MHLLDDRVGDAAATTEAEADSDDERSVVYLCFRDTSSSRFSHLTCLEYLFSQWEKSAQKQITPSVGKYTLSNGEWTSCRGYHGGFSL